MTVETHGDGVGWDERQRTWQAGDVIINLVLYFVPHPISKIKIAHFGDSQPEGTRAAVFVLGGLCMPHGRVI